MIKLENGGVTVSKWPRHVEILKIADEITKNEGQNFKMYEPM
jgi:hypothetical protein